jgi:hypothetical protein
LIRDAAGNLYGTTMNGGGYRIGDLHNGSVRVRERFAAFFTRKLVPGSPARRPAVKKKPVASPAGSA